MPHKSLRHRLLLGCGLSATLATGLSITTTAEAGTIKDIQSNARPLGLGAASPVFVAGSDEKAAIFQSEALNLMLDLQQETLGEGIAVDNAELIALDPSQLTATVSFRPRIYFVTEGAGYKNSFLAKAIRADGTETDWEVLFPDASMGTGQPLDPGDFVETTFDLNEGDRLGLMLVANGANGGQHIYGTEPGMNSDGFDPHVVSLLVEDDQGDIRPEVMIGFEDLYGGGDEDYNDLVVAIDFGAQNVGMLQETAAIDAAVPVPPGAWLFGSAIGFYTARRARKRE
ncbi:MAG: DUF4114 domain-containing protein [Parvularculaceae bacterium]|nr:DUF4114 domain-containing protein [Parvularculaceae bacterium]